MLKFNDKGGTIMLKRRIIIALLSTVIYSLVLAYIMYTPIPDRHLDTWYDSFGAPLPFLLFITGAAYLIGGISASSLIDKYVDKEIIKLPIYLIAGFIVGVMTIMVSFSTISLELLQFGIYGAAGSLIFFIFMLLNKTFEKASSGNENAS